MPGKFIEGKSGFLDVQSLATDLIQELLNNGFQQIFPAVTFDASLHKNVIMKPTALVDSLISTSPSQAWAIKFEWDDPATTDGMMDVYVATPAQFNTSTGDHALFNVGNEQEALGILGSSNKNYPGNDASFPESIEDYPKMGLQRDPISKTFLYRKHISISQKSSHPMSYSVSITNRGLAVSVWEETSDDTGNRNSWFVVQRPVKSTDGATITTGKCPVHCIYGLSGKNENKPWLNQEYGNTFTGFPWQVIAEALITDLTIPGEKDKFWKKILEGGTLAGLNNEYDVVTAPGTGKYQVMNWTGVDEAYRVVPKPKTYCLNRFIVREKDITAPYPTQQYNKDGLLPDPGFGSGKDYSEYGRQFGVPADEHTVDYAAIINTKQQVSISEGSKYVITFPNGMNTSRFAYTHEMDMVAYTSADVVSAGSEITIQVYGEATPRTYIGMNSNGPNNTGMRILFLKSGGGID